MLHSQTQTEKNKTNIMKPIRQITGITLMLLSFSACNKHNAKKEDTRFCLTPSMMLSTHLDTARTAEVKTRLVLSGQITCNEQKTIRVFPLAGGKVVSMKAELGDFVNEGQELAVIRSGEAAGFSQQMVAAESALTLAKKNLDAAEDMLHAGIISSRDYLAAEKEYDVASAEVRRVREMLKIYNVSDGADYIIKAPVSGYILEKNINNNMDIRPDASESVFTISDLGEVWVMANVYESDIANIKTGYGAEISTISYPGKTLKGTVDRIFNTVDLESRVMKVRIKLDNPGCLLKPGMFANIILLIPEGRKMISVDSGALVFDRNRNYVIVFRDKCDLDVREVKIYKTSDDRTYISGDIREGERLITHDELFIFKTIMERGL